MKEKVIVLGASGHAKVIIDIFEQGNAYEILGLIDDALPVGSQVGRYNILGCTADLPELHKTLPSFKVFIAIGNNWIRYKVWQKILDLSPKTKYANAIHPSALIAKGVQLKTGIAIMAGAIVNSNAIVKRFAIINTKSSLDHDSELGDFSSLAPNVTTGGNVTIGRLSAISLSSTIKHGITIGSYCVIGAGALVLKDVPDNSITYGVPAKHIKSRKPEDNYL